jgi:hypothetical protein
MSSLKIDELMFCEALVGQALVATQGGFSLNIYRGRRSFRKSVDGFGETAEKTGYKQGEAPLPNAPVGAPVVTPGELSVVGTGIVSTAEGGRFSGTSASLSGAGGFSIGTSI